MRDESAITPYQNCRRDAGNTFSSGLLTPSLSLSDGERTHERAFGNRAPELGRRQLVAARLGTSCPHLRFMGSLLDLSATLWNQEPDAVVVTDVSPPVLLAGAL